MQCVYEVPRLPASAGTRGPKPAIKPVWHLIGEGGHTPTWCPIACSNYEGIVLPAAAVDREPTCEECRQIAGLE